LSSEDANNITHLAILSR